MTPIQHAAEALQSLRDATAKHLRCADGNGATDLAKHYQGQLAGLDLALLVLSWENDNAHQHSDFVAEMEGGSTL